jgi:hypothetical protein
MDEASTALASDCQSYGRRPKTSIVLLTRSILMLISKESMEYGKQSAQSYQGPTARQNTAKAPRRLALIVRSSPLVPGDRNSLVTTLGTGQRQDCSVVSGISARCPVIGQTYGNHLFTKDLDSGSLAFGVIRPLRPGRSRPVTPSSAGGRGAPRAARRWRAAPPTTAATPARGAAWARRGCSQRGWGWPTVSGRRR